MRKIRIDTGRNNLPITIWNDRIHAVEAQEGIITISVELYEAIKEELTREKVTPTQMSLFK